MSPQDVTYRRIVRFWLPLAGTWLMMSVEGPFLTALIARQAEPKENLAAFGIAFAFALILESPIINLLSASTALVEDRNSFLSLRRYSYSLNAALTVALLVVLAPPIFDLLSLRLLALEPRVAELTRGALALLLPWPAAIGYRRFHQGVLVRHDMTRRVAYGTVIRLGSMATAGLVGWRLLSLPGAWVGALGLATGVIAEAVASRLMARGIEGELLEPGPERPAGEWLSFPEITRFYLPLAFTSILAMAVHPMVTFFLGRARQPLESLAVMPVVYGLTFFFRSMGLSFQEVGIALMGDRGEHYPRLRNFALGLALAAGAGLTLVAFSPLAVLWYRHVAGLSPELTAYALPPTQILALLPVLSVMMAFQRALLVSARRTGPLTGATITEVGGIATLLAIGIFGLDLVGANAAAIALILGRGTGNLYLVPACLAAVRSLRGRPPRETEPIESAPSGSSETPRAAPGPSSVSAGALPGESHPQASGN